jgi:glutamate racemase
MSQLVGFFDSGVGGLTVLKQFIRELPNEKTVYFGDMGRAPYGTRSPEIIRRYTRQVVRFLLQNFEVKLLVAACNTISVRALEHLAPQCPAPLLGVVEPVPRAAVAATRNKRVGIIGSHSAISSGVYQSRIRELDPEIQVFAQECPLFMPLVEEGWQNEPATRLVAESYLELIKYSKVDTLILGCTHYPVLSRVIADVLGPEVTLIDPAVECVRGVKEYLSQHRLLSKVAKPDRLFYVTDKPDAFRLMGERYLDRKINNVSLVDIDLLETLCPEPGMLKAKFPLGLSAPRQ